MILAQTSLSPTLRVWAAISFVAAFAIAGEVLIASGMRDLGDLDLIRERSGILGAIKAVLTSGKFVLGALCMALNFFAMLFALSIAELSLAAPPSPRSPTSATPSQPNSSSAKKSTTAAGSPPPS